jgi:hypothetical protein
MLCEECIAKCAKCGILVCPDHLYKTHSGKILCLPCQAKRRAEHTGKRGEDEGEEAGTGMTPEAELEEERPILVGSIRQPPPPWQLSLYIAGLGIAAGLLMLVAPGLRRVPLPWGGHFPTPVLLMLIPAIAIVWAVCGMVLPEHKEHRPRCLMGIGLALLSCILMIFTVYTDPARLADAEARKAEGVRNSMSADQLKQWREEKLQKFGTQK